LPTNLPNHVRIICASLPDMPSLEAIEARIPEGWRQRLDRMSRADGDRLLTQWLEQAGRTLQPHQREEVLGRFVAPDQPGGLPLYLKLAFEEARRWTSYMPAHKTLLTSDVGGLLRQLFARLSESANHGPLLVGRSLAYLAAAKQGLSEDEMLDVLSADAEVMADFERKALHMVENRRLPVVIWSRLYYDVEPYLTERSIEGGVVFSYYHRQLAEAITAEYLAGDEGIRRHCQLADYFSAQLPISAHDAEVPDTSEQTRQVVPGIARPPVLRALDELPYQQTMGELWDAVYATLTDFSFLEAKVNSLGVAEHRGADGAITKTHTAVYLLQDDYALALARMPRE
jgi:NACHT domain- and WD repeat-containing protein